MAKHKAVIVGAGRVGAAYKFMDDSYSHAGAYRALRDRVELMGFVEPDPVRGQAAFEKWGVPWATSINYFQDFDIVSVCVQPEQQAGVLAKLAGVKGVWCEKPWVSPNVHFEVPVQVNFLRRADPVHRMIAKQHPGGLLRVTAKDDIHTRCHFEDLKRWWKCRMEYDVIQDGPCSYEYEGTVFANGGIVPGHCMMGMLLDLLEAVDNRTETWSPPYVE